MVVRKPARPPDPPVTAALRRLCHADWLCWYSILARAPQLWQLVVRLSVLARIDASNIAVHHYSSFKPTQQNPETKADVLLRAPAVTAGARRATRRHVMRSAAGTVSLPLLVAAQIDCTVIPAHLPMQQRLSHCCRASVMASPAVASACSPAYSGFALTTASVCGAAPVEHGQRGRHMMLGRASTVISEGTVRDGGAARSSATQTALSPLRRTPVVSS